MHLLYQEGGTDIEVRVALAIPPSMAMSHDLWYDLIEREPEFSQAVKEGNLLAEAWWMRKGREGLISYEGVKFNNTLWIVNMRHRFKCTGADRVTDHKQGEEATPRTDVRRKLVDEIRRLNTLSANERVIQVKKTKLFAAVLGLVAAALISVSTNAQPTAT